MFNYVVVWFLECILLLKELDVCCDSSKTEIENSISTKSIFYTFHFLYLAKEYNGGRKQELLRFGARGLGGQRNRTRVRL